jgi:predicted DNA-binding transcriptional regulator AlpA
MSETPKVAVTVAEMARMCGLGRSRFYQLVGTAFPFPVYAVSTRRPFYNQEMQQVCLEVRRRNCGIDGRPILFYAKPINRKPSAKKTTSKVVPVPGQGELIEGLRALGMNATASQVTSAISTLYPSGTNGVDPSSILRSVFIHLQSQDK